jgi:hypothetical protein
MYSAINRFRYKANLASESDGQAAGELEIDSGVREDASLLKKHNSGLCLSIDNAPIRAIISEGVLHVE